MGTDLPDRGVVEGTPSRARHIVLAGVLSLTAISYLDRVCISMVLPFLQADLHLDDFRIALVLSAFSFAYALFEMPTGWLADRLGPRLMLSRVVLWWSLMTAMTGWVGGFASLFTVRLLFGAGEAGTFPGIARVFARWMPSRQHGRAFGLALMTAALGGAATQVLTARLLQTMGWRHVFQIYALVGVLWAIFWYWWFRDDPHQHAAVNESELRLIGTPPPAPSRRVPWGSLVRNRTLQALCCMTFAALYGWYFYLNWIPKYLLQARGFDIKSVGLMAALPLLAIAGGVLLGGWMSDVLSRRWGLTAGRRTPGLIGFPVAAGAVILAISTSSAVGAALLLALAGGAAAFAVIPAFAVCVDIGSEHAGTVSGTMNMFANLGGALSPIVIGLCLDKWKAWDVPLWTVAAAYMVAAACWLAVDPTRVIRSGPER